MTDVPHGPHDAQGGVERAALVRTAAATVARLEALGSAADLEGMRRYGVGGERAFGVKVGPIRDLARGLKKAHASAERHALAALLWESGWREARLVAAMIEDEHLAERAQIAAWLADLDSWDVCDGVCNELVRRLPWAWDEVPTWCRDGREYVRRAGFVTVATLAVHDWHAPDERFLAVFPLAEEAAVDPRNAVRKGVNWCVRQIGKRNSALNAAAIALAQRLRETGVPSARWIASDALRELRSEAVQGLVSRHGRAGSEA